MKPTRSRLLGRSVLTRGLAAVVALTLLAVVIVSSLQLRSSASEEAERDAVLSAARRAAVTFATYDHASLDASFNRLKSLGTEDFQRQFDTASKRLKPLILKMKASARGEALAAALVESTDDEDTRSVLVAVDATITNRDLPTGKVQRFRLKVTLQRVGEKWLLDKITTVV
jgi:Mce-associated membrane protein